MAGQYLGARNPQRAVRSTLLACLVGGGLMSAAGLAFYFAGQPLTMFFTGQRDVETRALTVELLRVVAVPNAG